MSRAAAMTTSARRPWVVVLTLFGMLFAGSAGQLPLTPVQAGHLCSAQGASQPTQPGAAEQHECCVLCPAGPLAGTVPDMVGGLSTLRIVTIALVPAAPGIHFGRVAGVAQARAPPSV